MKMKTIGADLHWPIYLHYRPAYARIQAEVALYRTTESMSATIHIPMDSIRELIAGLTEMADAHDAESRQEVTP